MIFAHLTLAVKDPYASSDFFAKTLGWKPITLPGNVDIVATWLEIAPGQQIHLLKIEGGRTGDSDREFGRHFAIFHPGSDFPALKQRLTENGAQIVPPIRPTPFERFFFLDLDGYSFEVIDQQGYRRE